MTRFNWGPAPKPSIHEVRKDLLVSTTPLDTEWRCPPDANVYASDWYVRIESAAERKEAKEVSNSPALAYPGGRVEAWKIIKTDTGHDFECEFDYLTGEKKGLWH